jgi:hypothetical protein
MGGDPVFDTDFINHGSIDGNPSFHENAQNNGDIE